MKPVPHPCALPHQYSLAICLTKQLLYHNFGTVFHVDLQYVM